MKITEEEKKAIIESIEHWIRDMLERLLKGDEIIDDGFGYFWRSDYSDVLDTCDDCALCELYGYVEMHPNPDCKSCVYTRKYGYDCDAATGHWTRWRDSRDIDSCIDMINALIGLLPEEERVKYKKDKRLKRSIWNRIKRRWRGFLDGTRLTFLFSRH